MAASSLAQNLLVTSEQILVSQYQYAVPSRGSCKGKIRQLPVVDRMPLLRGVIGSRSCSNILVNVMAE